MVPITSVLITSLDDLAPKAVTAAASRTVRRRDQHGKRNGKKDVANETFHGTCAHAFDC